MGLSSSGELGKSIKQYPSTSQKFDIWLTVNILLLSASSYSPKLKGGNRDKNLWSSYSMTSKDTHIPK